MNSIPGIDPKYGTSIINLFKELPEKTSVVLFGSRAKGNYREGSDIDIALKGDKLTLEHRDALLAKYEDLNLPWKLDVVIYSNILESDLKEHIDRVGKIII